MSNFRVISLFSAAVMAAGLLAGCGSNTGSTQAGSGAESQVQTEPRLRKLPAAKVKPRRPGMLRAACAP